MSYNMSKGESTDGFPWPGFRESTSSTSTCVINLKPGTQAEALGQINRPFSQEDGGCVSGTMLSVVT